MTPASILVADDDQTIRTMIRQILAIQGYDVTEAVDGEDAIRKIRLIKPDLILTDVQMPNANGYQVCQAIKSDPALKRIPILVLTVLDSNEERVKGLDAGADDFINKPFNPPELLARVRAFLRTKALHDELERSYAKLKVLETLRDAFTGMIIHDLKSPLNAISGSIQVSVESLEASNIVTPDEIHLLRNAEDSCKHMMDLLSDILDVSRMEQREFPLHKERASLHRLILKCLELLEPLRMKYNIQFKQDIDPGVPDVMADPVIIGRVLANIISNSFKFTPKNGTITVSLKNVDKEAEIAIQDTGTGIPEKDLERVFEKFYQGDDLTATRKGQGVGLTFCKMAVEAHGGRIWAESDGKQGSRFVIRLPL